MKKTPLLALAAAAVVIAGVTPALAGDHVGFSIGIFSGGGGYDRDYDRDYDRARWHHEHERWERDHYYGGPVYYGRTVVVREPRWHDRDWDRDHDQGYHRGWDHDRDWR